jgi:hypothetical protein
MSFGRNVPTYRENCASFFMVDPIGRTKHASTKRRTYLPNARRHTADNCGLKVFCQKNFRPYKYGKDHYVILPALTGRYDIHVRVSSWNPVVLVKLRTAYSKIENSPFVPLYIHILTTPVTLLHCTNRLFSISETDGVLCEVRTGFLYILRIVLIVGPSMCTHYLSSLYGTNDPLKMAPTCRKMSGYIFGTH